MTTEHHRLYRAHDQAASFYRRQLTGPRGETARNYLKENPEVAKKLEAELREKFQPADAKRDEEDDKAGAHA